VARRTLPERVSVRMYQVGFGDCFLVTCSYPRPLSDGRRERQLLFDFGSTHNPRGQDLDMAEVASRIATDCHGKLDVVITTHRHKDHISGFANDQAAAIIEHLEPALIVQPWTENPKAASSATGPVGRESKRLLTALAAGDRFAADLTQSVLRRPRGLRGDLIELAVDQLRNAKASNRLNTWASERDGEYLYAGSASKISQVVPGLEVEVLGPPTVDQHPDVVNQRSRDPEYWMLYRGLVQSSGLSSLLGSHDTGSEDDADDSEQIGQQPGIAPDSLLAIPAGPARWLATRLQRQQLHSLQRIVRDLDDALNNTSLLLLLTVGSRRLLFPGDAQIESWRYTLQTLDRDTRLRQRLADVDLYKVGHHGSRNATPRSLVKLWTGERPLAALLSTRPGTHGTTAATAVPRATLVAALEARADVHSTADLTKGGAITVSADVRGRHAAFELDS
jgi:hypothetical protein